MNKSDISQGKIKRLPNFLVDQIKAGEVIESPSSLLKELLENSIDAHATRIDITIKNNGLEELRIHDNGEGIAPKDLPLAFTRHATSKINCFEDLYQLHSFGFRGEALASAASVSRIECSSKTDFDEEGGKIILEGGKILEHSTSVPLNQGTTISVKDLFFNTPVRMKFIKAEKKEKRSLMRIIHAFMLANPQITFSLQWDQQEKELFPTTQESNNPLLKRILQIFPWIKGETDLIHFQQQYDNHSVEGFIQHTSTRSTTKRVNYLFANQRLFTEQSYHYLITQNCKKLWQEGEQGSYILFLKIPPAEIDVNIHPNKTRIKFAKNAEVYALISSAIKHALKHIPQQSLTNSCPPPTTTSLPKNNHHLPAESINNQEDNLIELLNDDLLLIRHHSEIYLSESRLLLIVTFNYYYNNQNDTNQVPLVITRPFATNYSAEHFDFLRPYGIEFNTLNQEKITLQTIPEWLTSTSYGALIQTMINRVTNRTQTLDELLPDKYPYASIIKGIPSYYLRPVILNSLDKFIPLTPELLKQIRKISHG